MIRIVILALAALLLATAPANAIPVAFVAAALAISATGFAAAAITFALNFILSAVLSFVAQSLLKPAVPAGKSPTFGGGGGGSNPVDNKITVRQAAAPRAIVYGETRVGGVYGFIHTTNNNNYLHLAIMVAGHEIDSFQEVWINDVAYAVSALDGDGFITVESPFAGKIRFKFHTGGATQAADADLMVDAPDFWNATDRLRGIAYIYARLTWDGTAFNSGVPNITAVIRGRKIYDPRSGLTVWSANSALVIADYLCDATFGIPVTYATGIDETALIVAANVCDENVTLAAGGTEKRYRTDGAVTCDAEPQVVLGKLLGAMHGVAPYDGEQWKIMAGAYQTPVLTFTDDDLRAGPKVQTVTSRRDLFNAIKGTYIGASPAVGAEGVARYYQVVDFAPIVSATYEAQDGQRLYKDIALPLTTSAARAQRIAKIDLLKARQQIVATMPCKLTVWRCQVGDTILWTSTRYGWTAKPFEVAEARFAVDPQSQALGVDLVLRETASSVYDWTTDQESTVDPAPNTNFPAVFDVLPASSLTATEGLYSTRDGGGVKAKVTLAWTASADAFVTSGGTYQAEYRLSGASAWTSTPRVEATTTDILDIVPGIYEFRVAAVNWAGNLSDYTSLTKSIAGLSTAPVTPTNLTVNASGGLAVARWTLAPDLDVREGGSVVFRHSALTSGATWADGITISEPLAGNGSVAVLPLKAGTYMTKFLDGSGVWSVDPATFVQAQASVLTFVALAGGSAVEEPAFAGTLTSCFVESSALKLGGATAFDAVADVDALTLWDYTGGVSATGNYLFAASMDLGSVKKCRLTSGLTTQVVDVFDLFDSRTGLVDDWPSWDGAVTGGEADATLMTRSTQTNPAATPTWTEWQRLDSADFSARGFQFRLDLTSGDPAYNISVSALTVAAEGV